MRRESRKNDSPLQKSAAAADHASYQAFPKGNEPLAAESETKV